MIRCAQSSKKHGSQRRFTFQPSLRIVLLVAVLLAAPGVFAQTSVDFGCGGAVACTGAVIQAGSNFSTSASNIISLYNSTVFSSSVPFTLAFNTATKTISIDGTGMYAGMNLIGTIVSFTPFSFPTTSGLMLNTVFTSLPAAVAAKLGTPAATSQIGFVIYTTKGGNALSVDFPLSPTPEPASMLLFGTGLLAIGALLRKRRTTATT